MQIAENAALRRFVFRFLPIDVRSSTSKRYRADACNRMRGMKGRGEQRCKVLAAKHSIL